VKFDHFKPSLVHDFWGHELWSLKGNSLEIQKVWLDATWASSKAVFLHVVSISFLKVNEIISFHQISPHVV
jgi:hypothetical protein